MKRILTLVIVRQKGSVLLGMKKRGFGAGKWNGFGGKVEQGETIEQAAMRECQEEAGIVPKNLDCVGRLVFHYAGDVPDHDVIIFSTGMFDGVVCESEEMYPQWFIEEALPFDDMWPDDRYWFPLLLSGKMFSGEFSFDEENRIIGYTVRELPTSL